MSAELLKTLKQQAERLTPQEKSQLADHLLEEVEANRSHLARVSETTDEVRRRRLEWLKAHREEYAEQYVALDGDRLVGHGSSIGEAHRQAKERGVPNPFLVRLTSEREIPFAGW